MYPYKGIKLINPDINNIFLKNGALLYEEIKGLILYEKYFNKINKENLSSKLSLFLNELYLIPIKESDIPKSKNKIIFEFKEDIEIINDFLKGNGVEKINNFKNEFLEYINVFNDFHYIHGDLWEENMIISEDYQDLIGIVDFDNFSIGDIAKDYATLLDLGFDFINILINKNEKCIKNRDEFVKRIKLYEYSKKYYKYHSLIGDSALFIQNKKYDNIICTYLLFENKNILELSYIFVYNDSSKFIDEVKEHIKGKGFINYIINRQLQYKVSSEFLKLNDENSVIGNYKICKTISLDHNLINKNKKYI